MHRYLHNYTYIVLVVVLVSFGFWSPLGFHADVLEPVRTAIFPVEPLFAVCKASRHASSTLGRVWTVKEGNVLVSNVLEPRL